MNSRTHNTALRLVDDLVADGKAHFTFGEAVDRVGISPTATANLLRRLVVSGLIDRVRRGHYVIRQLGVLGTSAAAEDISLAVGAAFADITHRMAYRTALDEHDLIVHPSRSIFVATCKRVRTNTLSGRPLHTIQEPESKITVGAIACGSSWVSNTERALLDSAMRPKLVGGIAVLAEAIAAAGTGVDIAVLTHYAIELNWAAALRRIGSIADALEIKGLAGRLRPIRRITADLDLEPDEKSACVWRDTTWRVRWPQSRDELASVVRQ